MKNENHLRQKLATAVLALMLGAGASTVNAQNLINNGDTEAATLNQWIGKTAISTDAHSGSQSFQVDGHALLQSKQIIAIDLEKTYTLSGWFKAAGEKPSKIYLGFIAIDKNKKPITSMHINTVKDTSTTLAKACVKGDTVLKVADASKWSVNNRLLVAFDASADFMDLPNRQLSNLGITAIENKGDHWEVTLTKPCKQDSPAGTSIRLHQSVGTYMYPGATNKTVPIGQWTQFSGKIKGIALNSAARNQFWAGTESVRILILANYGMKKEGTLLIDDLQLTAE